MARDPLFPRGGLGHSPYFTFLSRFLARHSVPLSPEQLAPAEGSRAALATVTALLPALYFHQVIFAWAAFAAFWSCLIEPGGTPREQLKILGLFTLGGSVLGAVTSLVAALPVAGVILWLVLAGLGTGLARALRPSMSLLMTLLACVMLAGIAFPVTDPWNALLIGLSVCGGGVWAMFLCLVVWPQHPYAAARRAVAACYRLLARMAGELAAGRLRETVHRQAVRSAIERARGITLQIDAGHASFAMRVRLVAALAGAERLFTAMLAVEHLVETRGLDFEARGTLAALSALCQNASEISFSPLPDLERLSEEASGLARDIPVRPGSIGEVVASSARMLASLADGLAREGELPFDAEAPRHAARLTPAIWRHTLRLVVGLVGTYAATRWLHLEFGFWALVSVLLVIQPSGETTLVRALERVLGTLAGSLLAMLASPFLPGPAEKLAAVAVFVIAAISMRAVNYTLLMLFVSAQFIIVADMTMPAAGTAWLRVADNTLGAVIGLLCAFSVCPERRGQDMDGLLRAAIVGNLRYLAAVLGRRDMLATDRIQRQAGIDTTRAEFSRGSLPVLGGVSSVGENARKAHVLLRSLRRLSGEATLLRFDIAAGLCKGDDDSARRWAEEAEALEKGAPLDEIARQLEEGSIMAEIMALDRMEASPRS
ncbi:FUSC family protein [Gluconobacter morbifer]|uniref:Integral membrane bound transporter domain-containing protein n=1 Tax=Gluconobacter morbifer G707 TaxID=1088869 RepID=G6XFM6_9PROT|nr:FUSC family protein [Gluconobacter morbifer]EHH68984.1 hypothetical protein GMO_02910 [Gluconobacter morbifer G707]